VFPIQFAKYSLKGITLSFKTDRDEIEIQRYTDTDADAVSSD
jgi:hypothetical protein